MRPPDYALFVRRMVMEMPSTPAQGHDFWAFLCSQSGKPYDYRALWAFAADRDWRAPDSWICSELVCAALEHAKISPQIYIPSAKITPRDVALISSVLGGTVICDESHLA